MLKRLSIRTRMTLLVSALLMVSAVILGGLVNLAGKKQLTSLASHPAKIIYEPPLLIQSSAEGDITYSDLRPAQFIESINPNWVMKELVLSEQPFHAIIPTFPTANAIASGIPFSDSTMLLPVTPIETTPYYMQLNYDSLFSSIFIIIAGSFCMYFLAGKILKPIRTLSHQVESITQNQLDTPLQLPEAKDEVYGLVESFNVMLQKLSKAFETQKNFSAHAAHELRTPLAVLQTKLDVFDKNQAATVEDYQELITDIKKQTDRLSSLVVNLLEFSNATNVELTQSVDLNIMIDEIICDLEHIAAKNSIRLSLDEGTCTVKGSDALLYRAFYNIIENAIKYNNPHGTVSVEISPGMVKVYDTGIGIPDTMKDKVLDAFVRVDKSRSREYGGSGLGLALSHEIIKAHHGTIRIADHAPQGTIVEIAFHSIL